MAIAFSASPTLSYRNQSIAYGTPGTLVALQRSPRTTAIESLGAGVVARMALSLARRKSPRAAVL